MSNIPPTGPQIETDTLGNGPRPSGWYKHPVNGTEFIAMGTVDYGNPQADAAVRLGFVFDRPVAEGDIKQRMPDFKGEQINVSDADDVSSLQAEVEALRAQLADSNASKAQKTNKASKPAAKKPANKKK